MAAVTDAQAAWPASEQTPIAQLRSPEFWPNDPSYAPSANLSYQAGSGQWWLYSFPPERAPNALLLLQPDLAAGLSVDAAWRYGTGKPAVVLALIDDGIDWSQADLNEGYLLNPGELQLLPPRHSDGSTCARLVPSDPNSPRLDCSAPPDGLVTVNDFRETLRWLHGSVGDDPNDNGILDPEDIFIRYQNNVDDDGNGLVDDIVGWDFADGSPNPGRPSAAHGTEVALDAIARANNQLGRAGACPSCLALPIRVADQRGADPQRLALAILYAASRGATAALVGHLPSGRSAALEKSLRVAAQRGMLVLFPQDGEQQNHPPVLFDLDSWLPVGALTTHGDDDRTDRTLSFVSLDPTQSLGPGVNLMGSGPTRSRRAQAIVLGVAGLVASASGTGQPRPTPLELSATLKWTADPIDPGLTSPTDVPTRPGSIRRVNANSAVEAVRQELLPPELEIERPYWHEPILQDTAAALLVLGRLSATHADTVDLQVSMALGDRPDDTNFRAVSSREGIDPTELTTSGSTLATLEPRNFEQALASSDGAAGNIVTIRVRATAHHERLSTTTSTEVERRIVLLRDPDLIFGAPTRIGSKGTAPKLADVNGDGTREVLVGTLDGELLIYSAQQGSLVRVGETLRTHLISDDQRVKPVPLPTPLPEAKYLYSADHGYSPIVAPPAIADLDSDGQVEIVYASLDGDVFAYHWDGSSPAGWSTISLPEPPEACVEPGAANAECLRSARLQRGISSSPVVGDVNGDDKLDLIVAARDGRIHAYGSDGKPLQGWPLDIGIGPNMTPGPLVHSPAVADVDGDAIDDVLVTAGEERSQDYSRGAHFLILGAHPPALPRLADGWPVGVVSYDFMADRLDRSTPPAAIDRSGPYPRALLYGNSSQPFYLPATPGTTQELAPAEHKGQLPTAAEPVSTLDDSRGFRLSSRGELSAFAGDIGFLPVLARASIGDLDRDSIADVVLPGFTSQSLQALRNNSHSERQGVLALLSGATGQMLHAAPIALDGFVSSTSAAIADLTNDGYPEIIIPNGAGSVVAIDACGRSVVGWPKLVGGAINNTPAVADIDANGSLEVVATTDDGWLYVWTTRGKADNYVPWGSANADQSNRSSYERLLSDATPLPLESADRCSMPPPIAPVESSASSARGGCACSVPSLGEHQGDSAWAWLLLVAIRRISNRQRRRLVVTPPPRASHEHGRGLLCAEGRT